MGTKDKPIGLTLDNPRFLVNFLADQGTYEVTVDAGVPTKYQVICNTLDEAMTKAHAWLAMQKEIARRAEQC